MHFRWWASDSTDLSRKTEVRLTLNIQVSGKRMGHNEQENSSPKKFMPSIQTLFFLISTWILPVGHLEQRLHTCMLLPFACPEGFVPGPWDMLQCSQDDLALHFDINFVQSMEIFCFSLHLLFSVKLCQYRKTTYVQVSSEPNSHHMTPPRSICWMRSVPKHSQLAPPASLHWC